ncbi:MAG: FKBP-type peptidyl-prolyl cis-trans isomerase [Candidatus Zapsychrus exili]|nr:FKBP-type peptidyl-prolyl cis-trans isomerase [Candidatus Zapsychrus exili]
MIDIGKKVRFSYTIKVEEGTKISKQEVEYTHGERKIISKLEDGFDGLNIGDKKIIKVSSKEGQIPYDESRVQEISKESLKNEKKLETGRRVQVKDDKSGKLISGTITEIKEEKCIINFNHPLAGKNLEFDVEVLSIN